MDAAQRVRFYPQQNGLGQISITIGFLIGRHIDAEPVDVGPFLIGQPTHKSIQNTAGIEQLKGMDSF